MTPEELVAFQNNYGGYWGPGCPEYPITDWQYEVANGDTRKGYWEWAYAMAHEIGGRG